MLKSIINLNNEQKEDKNVAEAQKINLDSFSLLNE